jgi:predicted transcriptional regulator
MMNREVSLGLWIRKRRKALDIAQQELAQRVVGSVSLIFRIESDERRPSR